MAFTNTVVLLALIPGLLMMLLPVVLFILLQVWLCKKSKKLGLILPILSLLLSLLLTFSLGAMQMVTTDPPMVTGGNELVVPAEEEGPTSLPAQETDVQEERRVNLTPGAVGAIAGVFLVSNIPTVAFGGIWLYYKNRRDFKDDLKRMKIEDLE